MCRDHETPEGSYGFRHIGESDIGSVDKKVVDLAEDIVIFIYYLLVAEDGRIIFDGLKMFVDIFAESQRIVKIGKEADDMNFFFGGKLDSGNDDNSVCLAAAHCSGTVKGTVVIGDRNDVQALQGRSTDDIGRGVHIITAW